MLHIPDLRLATRVQMRPSGSRADHAIPPRNRAHCSLRDPAETSGTVRFRKVSVKAWEAQTLAHDPKADKIPGLPASGRHAGALSIHSGLLS